MEDAQHRFGTLNVIVQDFLPVIGIYGNGEIDHHQFLQLTAVDIKTHPSEWPWPHLSHIYVSPVELLNWSPTLGDQMTLTGELNLTHLASAHGIETASQVAALYQRMVIYVNNWSEVNLIDRSRRKFDAMTETFAKDPWRFNDWLTQQNQLLPDNQSLHQLQNLLIDLDRARHDLFIRHAPTTAILQNVNVLGEPVRSGRFIPLALGHYKTTDHNTKYLDHHDLAKLTASLAKQSETLKREASTRRAQA